MKFLPCLETPGYDKLLTCKVTIYMYESVLPAIPKKMNEINQNSHSCIVNLGLFRSGTTTLVEAAKVLGLMTFREFPKLTTNEHKQFLINPKRIVHKWWEKGGREEAITLIRNYNLICDGWITLLAFLPPNTLWTLQEELKHDNIHVHFVMTLRMTEDTVVSKLQHWIIHNLERKTGLSSQERQDLEALLRSRAEAHRRHALMCNNGIQVHTLPLHHILSKWLVILSNFSHNPSEWQQALVRAGIRNANPPLPVEGILLTLRIGQGCEARDSLTTVMRLLDSIKANSLCQYLVVLGIDGDEAMSAKADALKTVIANCRRCESCSIAVNLLQPGGESFRICDVWHTMANKAWIDGADWVVLLGDDVAIDAPYHYRLFY